jgi:hypothetical protein
MTWKSTVKAPAVDLDPYAGRLRNNTLEGVAHARITPA